jgi:hypothetical protein
MLPVGHGVIAAPLPEMGWRWIVDAHERQFEPTKAAGDPFARKLFGEAHLC